MTERICHLIATIRPVAGAWFYKAFPQAAPNDDWRLTLEKRFGGEVYYGPFSGMKIPRSLYGRLQLSELLGLYESCLHPVLSSLLNSSYQGVVVVGGNNGYYAAGLSYLLRPRKITVFEIDASYHPHILSWFEINRMPKPEVRDLACAQTMADWNGPADLLFVDCEGAELELLDPGRYPWQKEADLVVEVHPFYVDGVVGEIAQRFRETHTVELVYDDFQEDKKIATILEGANIRAAYPRHPTHRWIERAGERVLTAGSFLILRRRPRRPA